MPDLVALGAADRLIDAPRSLADTTGGHRMISLRRTHSPLSLADDR